MKRVTRISLLYRMKSSCQRGARLPFGPFLSLGAGLSYFYGSFFWEWYVGFCYG